MEHTELVESEKRGTVDISRNVKLDGSVKFSYVPYVDVQLI